MTDVAVINFEIDKLRIFISDVQDRARSRCWYFISVGDAVYIGPDATGDKLKLSFHADDGSSCDGCNSQWGLTRTYAERETQLGTPNLLPLARWKRPETPQVGSVQVASIMFPTDFFGGTILPFKSGRKRIALPLAPPRHAIEIEVFYSRVDPSTINAVLNNAGRKPIGYMSLPGGENVVVAAHEVPFEAARVPLTSEREHVGHALRPRKEICRGRSRVTSPRTRSSPGSPKPIQATPRDSAIFPLRKSRSATHRPRKETCRVRSEVTLPRTRSPPGSPNPILATRLGLDRAAGTEDADDLVYDAQIAAAVAGFQKANGLPASGNLTGQTVAALSGGGSSLEAEILANMERWRWMPRDMGETHIEVNIPDYEAVVIDKGAVIERNRVVVGKEETPTPVFSEMMKFLIVNPSWNVPQSIIRKEMLPRLASDPGYFQKMGYEVSSRAGKLVVRQPPGEKNALGRIKFMFPNDFAVYMHDTPLRKLFASAKRAFSHGCVRVDDPFRFAETVLGDGWSESRVKKLIGAKERYVYLAKPLPVYLEYFTAFVDESGALQLRDDVYGYSRRVKAALGLQG